MSLNPRNRDLSKVTRNATRPTRLPGLIVPTTGNAAVDRWIGAVTERLQVYEGGSTPFDKVLTGRDLVSMGVVTATQVTNPATVQAPTAAGVVVSTGRGTVVQSIDEFSKSIKATQLYTDLTRRIDDPSRFNQLHERTKAALLEELAPIDGKITSEIRRVEEQFSNASEAFAQDVTTLRASVARAAAGVRSVRFASANENRATAGIVTTVTARLDNFSGGAPGTATVESKMTAIADRATGLEAQYTVKVSAGGAIAGIGLGATAPVGGTPSSAIILQADKFAIVDSSYAGGLDNTPDASAVPFGVDSNGVYINAPLFVNGTTGMSLVSGSDVGKIKLDASGNLVIQGTAANKDIGLLAPLGGGLMVRDFTIPGVAYQTSLIIDPPPGASGGVVPTSVIQNTGGHFGVTSVGGNLDLKAGAIGTATMTFTFGAASASTSLVTGLNADQVDGNDASAFATAGHNHSGVYLPVAGTAADSSLLGGIDSNGYTKVVLGDTGTATAGGGGLNMVMGTGLAPTYQVSCAGNVITLQTVSDERLKQDIEDETHGLAFIQALRPRRFRFISAPEYQQHGFVAQELASVAIPNEEKDSLAFTNPNGMMGIGHLALIAPLVKAVQELAAQVQAINAP